MSRAIAELLTQFGYAFLPPHIQAAAQPFRSAAVAIIEAGLNEAKLEEVLTELLEQQVRVLESLMEAM